MPSNSQESEQYRQQVYDLYLPLTGESKFQNMKRRFVLNHFCNGNIQQSETIEHFCPFNHCVDDEEVAFCFSTIVCWALIPTKPPKYSRGRWTNYDRATMWNGLLASHYSLLTQVIMKYTGSPQSQPVFKLTKGHSDTKAAPLTSTELTDSAQAAPGSNSDSGDEGGHWAKMLEDFAGSTAKTTDMKKKTQEPVEDAESGSDAPTVVIPEMKVFDFVEINRQQKANAGAWVQTDPAPRLSILHQVVRCFLSVMHNFLKVSGDNWQHEQETLADNGGQREYRALNCTKGSAVQQCFDALVAALARAPAAVPDTHHSRKYRNMFYCLTSRGCCAVYQLVRSGHSGFPYQLFQALADGWQSFSEVPPCLYDELTAEFAKHFSQTEHQADAFAALEALANVCHVDVARIECKHASNREFTMMRGRGWPVSLAVVSAKFACSSFRPLELKQKKLNRKKVLKLRKKARRPGGAWRAFLSQRLSGKPVSWGPHAEVSMTDISREYHSLSVGEKAYFLEVGHLATLAGRAGYKPFGEKNKTKKVAVETIEPGTITSTGAIVATSDGLENLSLVRSADQPFADSFKAFRAQVQALKPKAKPAAEPKTASAAVTKMAAEVAATAHSTSFSHGSISRVAQSQELLHHAYWSPPALEFAQATQGLLGWVRYHLVTI
jgi:hypothetical protein